MAVTPDRDAEIGHDSGHKGGTKLSTEIVDRWKR